MSKARIKRLFEARLKTWADAQVPPLPVAFPNATFTPPAGAHLACYILPADTFSDDLAGEHRAYIGVFQINIIVPPGTGEGAAGVIADALSSLFPLNLDLSTGAFHVFVRSPVRERSEVQEPDRYSLPVDFDYRADTY